MLDKAEPMGADELIELIKKLRFPIIAADSGFRCIYGAGLISEGELLSEYISAVPVCDGHDDLIGFTFGEKRYCGRIVSAVGLNIFEIFGDGEVTEIGSYTDLFQEIYSEQIKMNERLRAIREAVRDYSEKDIEFVSRVSHDLISVSVGLKRAEIFMDAMFRSPELAAVDIRKLTENIVKKCAGALEEKGLSISFFAAEEDMFICTDRLHAFYAILNSIRNSIFLADGEECPVVALTKMTAESSGKKTSFIELVIKSKCGKFFGNDDEEKFFRQGGADKSIIDRFVGETGGSFSAKRSEDGFLCVKFVFPSYEPEEYSFEVGMFESGGREVLSEEQLEYIELAVKDAVFRAEGFSY